MINCESDDRRENPRSRPLIAFLHLGINYVDFLVIAQCKAIILVRPHDSPPRPTIAFMSRCLLVLSRFNPAKCIGTKGSPDFGFSFFEGILGVCSQVVFLECGGDTSYLREKEEETFIFCS